MKTIKPQGLETARIHRWILKSRHRDEDRDLVLQKVEIKHKHIILTYYMAEDLVHKITSKKYPKKLKIELLHGDGTRLKQIVLTGVKFKRHIFEGLVLDYQKPEVMTHPVLLSFKKIKWK